MSNRLRGEETIIERLRRQDVAADAARIAKQVAILRKRRGIYLPSREQDRLSLIFQLALGEGLVRLPEPGGEEPSG
jgi:hypothetical protein